MSNNQNVSYHDVISAQEAFEASCKQNANIDVSKAILDANNKIRAAVADGYFATALDLIDGETGFYAEKACMELEKAGYYVSVSQHNIADTTNFGQYKFIFRININYKHLPPNSREYLG